MQADRQVSHDQRRGHRRPPLQTVDGLCGISAKSSGVVSLAIQTLALLMSFLFVALLFFHVGGYKKLFMRPSIQEHPSSNSTELYETSDLLRPMTTSHLPPMFPGSQIVMHLGDSSELKDESEGGEPVVSDEVGAADVEEEGETTIAQDDQGNSTAHDEIPTLLDAATKDDNGQQNQTTPAVDTELNEFNERVVEVNGTSRVRVLTPLAAPVVHGPFEQIREVQLKIGHAEVEMLPLLRAFCILYAMMCIGWLISLVGLLVSLKLEILDLIYINTFFLTVICVFTLVKALLVGTLIFQQSELRWNILLVICATVGGLIIAFIFEIVALCQIVVWYRYVDYINGGEEMCICTAAMANCIKGHVKRERRGGVPDPAQYSIPQATRHPHLPYIDDPPIQQFHNI